MERAFAIWRAFQDGVVAPAAALLLLGCTLLALIEIFRRYILGYSFEWQQDAVTFFILSGVYLYFSISQRHEEHLNVAMLTETLNNLGPRARYAADVVKLVGFVISFLFLLAVVWWGVPEVQDSLEFGSRTESLAFPMWPFLAVLLVGFTFMAVTIFFQIWRAFWKLRGRRVLEEEGDAGATGH